LIRALIGSVGALAAPHVRMWDMRTPASIDLMMANSKFIAQRVRKVYGRDALVLYPPVKTDAFQIGTAPRGDFYLAASRLVPYKRMDLIVQAFAGMPDRKLVMIGDGPDMAKIKAIATPNVEILGYQSFEVLRDHMQRAKAFVFAAQEDFGIVPVEAQACGTPVIALGQGGTAETVRPVGGHQRPTGVWFQRQTVADLQEAIRTFEANEDRFDPAVCREQALYFGADRFRDELQSIVSRGAEIGYDALLSERSASARKMSERFAAA
jgi:glycosyltransferase involved in cell wall biosynthesis